MIRRNVILLCAALCTMVRAKLFATRNAIMLRATLCTVLSAMLFAPICIGAQDDVAVDSLQLTSGESQTALVELYTSEGCSSCPPADRWFSQLGQTMSQHTLQHTLQQTDARAVLLAFHVDYWNYLGWVDPFARAAYSRRQRQAAAEKRVRGVYTPAFMVDGVGARGGEGVLRAIARANQTPANADIRAEIARHNFDANDDANDGDNDDAHNDLIAATIRITDRRESKRGALLAHLAVYENNIIRNIGGGENHGRTLRHDYVVRHFSRPLPIGRAANLQVALEDDWQRNHLGVAVIVVDASTSETVQAVDASLRPLFE